MSTQEEVENYLKTNFPDMDYNTYLSHLSGLCFIFGIKPNK